MSFPFIKRAHRRLDLPQLIQYFLISIIYPQYLMLAISNIQRPSHADRLEALADGVVALAHERRAGGKDLSILINFMLGTIWVFMDVVNIRFIFRGHSL
jgi:hypothetical protein